MMPVRCVPVDLASTPLGFPPLCLLSSPSMPKTLARDYWQCRSLLVHTWDSCNKINYYSKLSWWTFGNFTLLQDPEGKPKKANIRDNHDGTYLVSYVPDMTGRYTILIKYGGDEIPYSPYRIRALPTGDASKCTVTGTYRKLDHCTCICRHILGTSYLAEVGIFSKSIVLVNFSPVPYHPSDSSYTKVILRGNDIYCYTQYSHNYYKSSWMPLDYNEASLLVTYLYQKTPIFFRGRSDFHFEFMSPHIQMLLPLPAVHHILQSAELSCKRGQLRG